MHSDENYMKLSWINPEHGAIKFAPSNVYTKLVLYVTHNNDLHMVRKGKTFFIPAEV